MIKYSANFVVLMGLLWTGYTLAGCSDMKQKEKDEYLIRVRDRIITVGEFNRAFEIAKSAYPHNTLQQPDTVREARLRFVQQIAEEMILQERAEELGITVTDSEVEKALEDIKRDYPDNVFQNMLLEYAVPYHSWKNGVKTRLLMEKVITKDLGGKIEIMTDDISKYYKEHFKDDDTASEDNAVPKDKNDTIIEILRREKMEEAYEAWIRDLKNKYTVEINREQLEKATG